jgi:hypothetical protein
MQAGKIIATQAAQVLTLRQLTQKCVLKKHK